NAASFCVSAGTVRGVLYGSANCRGPRLQSEETGSRGGAPREIGFLRRPALAQRKSTRGQAYPVLARNKRLRDGVHAVEVPSDGRGFSQSRTEEFHGRDQAGARYLGADRRRREGAVPAQRGRRGISESAGRAEGGGGEPAEQGAGH